VNFSQIYLTVFLLAAMPLAGQEKIPLLISEHHADHMEFFFRHGLRHGEKASAAMIVLDAHSDTVANEQAGLIRNLAARGNFSRAGELTGNHEWIHPLVPAPLKTLVWISTIRGPPRGDKLRGFFNSISKWDEKIRTVYSSVEELRFLESGEEVLFISVDLDFFYSENHAPQDLPSVLDSLFSFASRRNVPVVWAICLSRPWLPDDAYAWTLLDWCLQWLSARPEFNAPELTLFNSRRVDSSRTAQAIRAEGREVPMLRETNAPARVKTLLRELQERK
jgi:hypothetical protein